MALCYKESYGCVGSRPTQGQTKDLPPRAGTGGLPLFSGPSSGRTDSSEITGWLGFGLLDDYGWPLPCKYFFQSPTKRAEKIPLPDFDDLLLEKGPA